MSCITKILETKGANEILVSGEIAIEGGGIYKGYEYLITFVANGHRCGYVAIPESHSLYKNDTCFDIDNIDVHGGVTFFESPRFEEFTGGHKCTDKWIGFDAGHFYDEACIETLEKYFGETDLIKYRKNNPIPKFVEEQEHRTYCYMEDQCKKLIDQLIEI